ncbi:MAG TPA: carbon-nitrogen hydrolase [Candidatus Acidoferrales bacterium]|nr:carbon-nitrogen hydrolase [Candidatus Acidoferrales bacterium]
MSDKFVIGLLQMRSTKNAAENLARAIEKIREAAKRGAQIVSMNELFAGEYFCRTENAELFNLAEAVPGPTTGVLAKVARENKVAIVASLFERRAAGLYHNTCAVLDADGSFLGKYRKMHIPDDPLYYEKFYFTPGDLGFPTFETRYGRIGIQICWDQWYPEGSRAVALGGAQVIFYPTSIGWHPAEKREFGAAQLDAWMTVQRGHAIANGVYVAVVNRVGFEGPGGAKGATPKRGPSTARPGAARKTETAGRSAQDDRPQSSDTGIEFWGNSFVADPFGRVVAEAPHAKEEILVVECDPARSEDTRRNWPFLRDRRVDAYEPILSRWLGK